MPTMIWPSKFWLLSGLSSLVLSGPCVAQVSATSRTPSTASPPLPLTSQIKKTIAFLDSGCLHDYTSELSPITQENLLKMTPDQRLAVVQQLLILTSKFQNLRPSMMKLNADERTRLIDNHRIDPNNADAMASEGEWRAKLVLKMMNLTPQDIQGLSTQELALLPIDEHLGTGFFVRLRDERLKLFSNGVANPGFTYLVTNRHVAQPGTEGNRPCTVAWMSIMLNRRPDATHLDTYAETIRLDPVAKWAFSDDPSVDLAVSPLGVPIDIYDYLTIGDEQFISESDVSERRVVEGDPVLFSGLFIQSYADVHTLEPIVRFGTLAMIPNGLVSTTMAHRPGHLYFAEAHAFGGNSGSPMFVDMNKFQGIIGGLDYRLLGIISGEVLETTDLKLNVTTTLTGAVGANSDISTVVPVAELVRLLKGEKLEGLRMQELATYKDRLPASNTSNQPKK